MTPTDRHTEALAHALDEFTACEHENGPEFYCIWNERPLCKECARLVAALRAALASPEAAPPAPADLVALTDALIAAANRRKGLPHGVARVGAEYDEAKAYEALLAYKLPAAAPRVPSLDVEGLIRTCVPGGQSCDPQGVADAIREWFAAPRVPERDTACLCCSDGCQDGCRCKPAAPPTPPQEDDDTEPCESCENCEKPIVGRVVRALDDVPLCETCADGLSQEPTR